MNKFVLSIGFAVCFSLQLAEASGLDLPGGQYFLMLSDDFQDNVFEPDDRPFINCEDAELPEGVRPAHRQPSGNNESLLLCSSVDPNDCQRLMFRYDAKQVRLEVIFFEFLSVEFEMRCKDGVCTIYRRRTFGKDQPMCRISQLDGGVLELDCTLLFKYIRGLPIVGSQVDLPDNPKANFRFQLNPDTFEYEFCYQENDQWICTPISEMKQDYRWLLRRFVLIWPEFWEPYWPPEWGDPEEPLEVDDILEDLLDLSGQIESKYLNQCLYTDLGNGL